MEEFNLTCGRCSATTPLPVAYIPTDGDLLGCGWCGTRYVVHLCNHNHGLSGLQSVVQTELLAILVGEVTKACPTCGVGYKIGDIVERVDPQAGRAIKQLALGAGIIVLLISTLSSTKKRR